MRALCFMILLRICLFPAMAKDALAILDFTDISSQKIFLEDQGRNTSLVHALMESLSVRMTQFFRVVERDKMDALYDEMELGESGVLSEATITHLGKMTGAKFVLTGSITEQASEEREFSQYHIRTKVITCRMVVVFKLIHIESGEIRFGGEQVAEVKTRLRDGFHYQDSDLARKLGRAAALQILNRTKEYFAEAQPPPAKPKATESFAFQISSEPERAMVDIDGLFAGQTPVEVSVSQGTHSIRFFRPGFQELVIKVNADKDKPIHIYLTEDSEK